MTTNRNTFIPPVKSDGKSKILLASVMYEGEKYLVMAYYDANKKQWLTEPPGSQVVEMIDWSEL